MQGWGGGTGHTDTTQRGGCPNSFLLFLSGCPRSPLSPHSPHSHHTSLAVECEAPLRSWNRDLCQTYSRASSEQVSHTPQRTPLAHLRRPVHNSAKTKTICPDDLIQGGSVQSSFLSAHHFQIRRQRDLPCFQSHGREKAACSEPEASIIPSTEDEGVGCIRMLFIRSGHGGGGWG